MNTVFQADAVDLLSQLVAIPSPSEQEAEAAGFLVSWMNEHGLQAHVDEAGNAVGTKGEGPQEILLLGHIDTFPGEIPVRRVGDLLYGRGTVDAKGPLCTFAAASAQVDLPPGWRLTVVGAVEEESATSKGARHILAQRLGNQEGKRPPAFCIIGEPSNWDRVTLGYKGRLLLDVVLQAPFSHSAGEGRLPAEQAVDLWQRIEQFCASFNQAEEATSPFNRLDPSLRHIASRDEGAFGVVDMSLGFRLPVGLGLTELEQQLRQLAQTLPDGSTADLHFFGGELAYKENKSNPLVRAFLRAIRTAKGRPRFVVKTGTADMNVVGPHWPDTPVVAYGPGDSSLDHTPEERIDLKEYLQAIEILKEVLAHLIET
jgi:LysW-gamma-L-lysine carboxypeptidase